MKYVVVDLEMNEINREYNEFRYICGMEIIQIGASLLDEKYQEIGYFSTLVKPEYNTEIEMRYQQLTGIHTDMVQNAPVFKEAMYSFFKWIENLHEEVEILSWSDSDLKQILKEADLKEYEFSEFDEEILSHWTDFQDEFGHELYMDQRISLKNALEKAGITFEGKQHDALFDARNTAKLLGIVRDKEKCDKVFGNITQFHTVSKCTLGDLFDFSQFDFDTIE